MATRLFVLFCINYTLLRLLVWPITHFWMEYGPIMPFVFVYDRCRGVKRPLREYRISYKWWEDDWWRSEERV